MGLYGILKNKAPAEAGAQGVDIMKLPPFAEFQKDFSQDKFLYDFERVAEGSLCEKDSSFTKEQYMLLAKIVLAATASMFQQYHEWLNQKLL